MKDIGLKNLYIFLAEKMVKDYKQGSLAIHNKIKSGITVDQWVVLKYINEHNGATQVEIAKSSAKDAPTTTRIIDQLVRKKLVERKADLNDRRKFKIVVTPKGTALVKKVLPNILKHRSNVIKGIPEKELNAFVTTLNKMLNNLSSKA
jgi:DNA-binding MarR family transcriptional regulator